MLRCATSVVIAMLAGLAAMSSVPAWDDWDHGRVQLSNVSIHFRYAGKGPPLVLVHGNPQHTVSLR